MSAAKKKKSTEGHGYYQIFNPTASTINELEKYYTADKMSTNQNKMLETLRLAIRQNALNKQQSNMTYKQLPVINQVVLIEDAKQFTDLTHDVKVAYAPCDYYSQLVTTKIVGMEKVDWWEYVLLYGFWKAFSISVEYAKLKSVLKDGMTSTRTVSGSELQIILSAKPYKTEKKEEIVGGVHYLAEKGTVYGNKIINIQIPLKRVEVKNEYKKGYFLYEETYDSLVPDETQVMVLPDLLKEYNLQDSLTKKIISIFTTLKTSSNG